MVAWDEATGTRPARGHRRASRLRIGTSGYVYRDWRGLVYPADLPVRDWLRYYASHFDSVELNSAFYRLPSITAYRGWRAQVSSTFRFAVKASRYLTHMKKLKDPRDPLRRMLRRARHLGPTLGPVRPVLEVRHASWLEPPVIQRLRDANVALCFHD